MSCIAGICVVDIGSRNLTEYERAKGVIVLSPNVVSVGVGGFIRTGNFAIKPGAEATHAGDEKKVSAPLKPIGLAEVKSKIRGP
jgi:hypothetical protein